jgi:transcriptional regulator with XRE-family HTH domain
MRAAPPNSSGWVDPVSATDIADSGFAAMLREFRDGARLTQEDLAHRSGVSVRAIRNLESGRTLRPYHGTVEMLVRGLGLGRVATDRLCTAARLQRIAADLAAVSGMRPVAGLRQLIESPRQLPLDTRHFVGRRDELRLLEEFSASNVSRGTPLVVVLCGPAGVGKTGLAVHWAHLAADRFPDGQLYANLGTECGDPAPAEEILPAFLRALGTAGESIPDRVSEQSALFRTLVADRGALIVLDNAHRADQVRPLLPATSRCTVLVTSRSRQRELVAREGAYRLVLDGLPELHAVRLLHALIGYRVECDPAAGYELARTCGCLPLALRVAAEFIASHPARPLRSLLQEAAGQLQRVMEMAEVPLSAHSPAPDAP